MKIAKQMCAALIILITLCSSGCTRSRTLLLKDAEKYWWTSGRTFVKAQGNEQWVEVVGVEHDSLYGKLVGVKSDSILVITLDSIQAIEKSRISSKRTFLLGLLIGAAIPFVAFSSGN